MANKHELQKRLKRGQCCWHCKYFLRKTSILQLDGPIGDICTIDREKNYYAIPDQVNVGDKTRKPTEYCKRFEMELPSD